MLIGREKEKQVGLTELTVNSCFAALSSLKLLLNIKSLLR